MDIDQLALDTTNKIENEFAKPHPGGVPQRKARIQILVRDALILMRGEKLRETRS